MIFDAELCYYLLRLDIIYNFLRFFFLLSLFDLKPTFGPKYTYQQPTNESFYQITDLLMHPAVVSFCVWLQY